MTITAISATNKNFHFITLQFFVSIGLTEIRTVGLKITCAHTDGVASAQDDADVDGTHDVGADDTHDGELRDDGIHAGVDGIPCGNDRGAAAIGDLRLHYSLLTTTVQ